MPKIGGEHLTEKIDALGGRNESVLFEDGEGVRTRGVISCWCEVIECWLFGGETTGRERKVLGEVKSAFTSGRCGVPETNLGQAVLGSC